MNDNEIAEELNETMNLLEATLRTNVPDIARDLAKAIVESLRSGGKVMFAGNGGSAADAQHMAAEFVNYFYFPRAPLAALALTTDSSILTSISNDSSFDYVFSRQVEALGKSGDILWVYTTSGTSRNVIRAVRSAKEMGLKVASFVGSSPELLAPFTDFLISVPSKKTSKIQEVHLTLGHAISGMVEARFFAK